MEMKPGYKRTEVGVIPEDWETFRLGDISEVSAGGTPSRANPSYWNGDIPWVTTSEVDFCTISSATQSITAEGLKNSAAKLFSPSTLLMALYGQGKTRGKVAVLGIEAATNQACAAISLHSTDSHKFLFHYLVGQYESIRSLSNNGNQENLNSSLVRSICVPYPKPREQCAITTALSDMDALLDGLNRLIAKKRAIKQASMQQLLIGQTRLPGFSGEWVTQKLGNDAILKARIGWQGLTTAEYLDDGDYFLVAGTDFLNGRIDWRNCHFVTQHRYSQDPFIQVRPRDVLVTKDGTIGKVALIDAMEKPAALNSGVFVIRPKADKFVPEFFYFLLASKVFEEFLAQLSAGSTINHLYQKDFVGFAYQIPPTTEEQTAIAEVLSDMDDEITALETRRAKTRALKQAMMQELLTGRTRLVAPSANTADKAESQTEGRKANVYFLRSVLAAEIIDQLHDQPTFGHVKFEKMMFLAEHLCQVDTGSTYHRKAAGPYDNRALRSIDSQLQKQQWFEPRKQDGRYQYMPLAKRGGHKPYFERHFSGIGETLEKILSTFKTAKTEQCEIVATLLAAWSDLLREHEAVSDEMIVHEVLHNWHEAKQRIPEDRWLMALGWMREKGLVPKGATLP
ncbi:hypothetical protein FOZ76_01085 [Verticiella sediminum]|uniref:Type I restriction modification DNA specificity domain-containing protein n=1 Tax=Verticiella sediminum TaxID=1247510 RepID=A0A556B1C6_9BURK|nr:restriction endonuclease subunit S [Verticiella sediminum]TSH98996.1 hypothetical protein FOZ76_01085 [Verticiella sediminum]